MLWTQHPFIDLDIVPPISAPLLPPNMVTHPAATQPMIGIFDTVGATDAPTLDPTSLPVFSPLPSALMHAICFSDSSVAAFPIGFALKP